MLELAWNRRDQSASEPFHVRLGFVILENRQLLPDLARSLLAELDVLLRRVLVGWRRDDRLRGHQDGRERNGQGGPYHRVGARDTCSECSSHVVVVVQDHVLARQLWQSRTRWLRFRFCARRRGRPWLTRR